MIILCVCTHHSLGLCSARRLSWVSLCQTVSSQMHFRGFQLTVWHPTLFHHCWSKQWRRVMTCCWCHNSKQNIQSVIMLGSSWSSVFCAVAPSCRDFREEENTAFTLFSLSPIKLVQLLQQGMDHFACCLPQEEGHCQDSLAQGLVGDQNNTFSMCKCPALLSLRGSCPVYTESYLICAIVLYHTGKGQ